MKKAVTLFSLLAMFLVVSCFSNAEPEDESETEPLILAERAGIYKGTITTTTKATTTVNHTLILDKSGEGMYTTKTTTTKTDDTVTEFLLVGVGGEITGTTFYALEIKNGIPGSNVATITFYADYPSKVTYLPVPATGDDAKPVDLIKKG